MSILHILTLMIFASVGVLGMAVILESMSRMGRFLPVKILPAEIRRRTIGRSLAYRTSQ